MSYRLIGSADGREVFVSSDSDDGNQSAPQGYSIAAVVLTENWKSDELGSLLNQLYGGIDDWSEFKPDAGARSFVFWGDRAEEASNLCDAFAYAWTRGAGSAYDDVIAASNDAADMPAFVEAMFSGEIAIGDSYADKVRSLIFTVPDADGDDTARDRIGRLTSVVEDAVKQHHFD